VVAASKPVGEAPLEAKGAGAGLAPIVEALKGLLQALGGAKAWLVPGGEAQPLAGDRAGAAAERARGAGQTVKFMKFTVSAQFREAEPDPVRRELPRYLRCQRARARERIAPCGDR